MKKPIPISPTIRTLFNTIRLFTTLDIQTQAVDQILKDCESDQVNEKTYQLSGQKGKVNLIGIVDEYEPETVWVIFKNTNGTTAKILKHIFDSYDFAFGTGSEFRSKDESLEIFNKGIEKLIVAHNNREFP